jgi:hypothetical protein
VLNINRFGHYKKGRYSPYLKELMNDFKYKYKAVFPPNRIFLKISRESVSN